MQHITISYRSQSDVHLAECSVKNLINKCAFIFWEIINCANPANESNLFEKISQQKPALHLCLFFDDLLIVLFLNEFLTGAERQLEV